MWYTWLYCYHIGFSSIDSQLLSLVCAQCENCICEKCLLCVSGLYAFLTYLWYVLVCICMQVYVDVCGCDICVCLCM